MRVCHLVLSLVPCAALLTPPKLTKNAVQRVKGTTLASSRTTEQFDRSQWQQNALPSQTHPETPVDTPVDGWLLLARAVLRVPAIPDKSVPLQKHTTSASTTHVSQARPATPPVRRLPSRHARRRNTASPLKQEAAMRASARASRLRERLQRLNRLRETAAASWDRNQMMMQRMVVLCLVLQERRINVGPALPHPPLHFSQ